MNASKPQRGTPSPISSCGLVLSSTRSFSWWPSPLTELLSEDSSATNLWLQFSRNKFCNGRALRWGSRHSEQRDLQQRTTTLISKIFWVWFVKQKNIKNNRNINSYLVFLFCFDILHFNPSKLAGSRKAKGCYFMDLMEIYYEENKINKNHPG